MTTLRTKLRAGLVAGVATLLAGGMLAAGPTAHAAQLFYDGFEGPDTTNGWTTSGGSWARTGGVLRQSGSTGDARAMPAAATWTDYTTSADVKPTAFNGSNRFVALLARVQSSTSYYYLALRSNHTVELKKLVNGAATTLASAPLTVTAGTSYRLTLAVVGTALTGQVGGVTLRATDSQYRSGQLGLATYYATADFDNVTATTSAPGSPSPSASSSTPPPPPPPAGGPTGFAAVNALGLNGTTGGAGGRTVTVSNATDFLAAIDSRETLIIRVAGTIAITSKQGVRPNKTIVGVGTSGHITGGGLDFYRSYNVIVRNLRFTNAEDDAVNVGQESHHIWIDHNSFSGAVDGSIDIVRGADYVTVSWNHFDHADKSMLIGHSDGAASTDVGHLKVTIHHNFFDHSRQRHPRVRFADPVHVYNNYYLGNELYGVASVQNAGVLVEGNYFEDVPFPIISTSGYADSGPGRAVQRNNIFVRSGTPETNGTVVEPRTFYSYTVDAPASVPAAVRAGAGYGKI